MDIQNISKAEEALRYIFNNKSLIEQALTHPSFCRGSERVYDSYERLEFLGDGLLGAYVAECAFNTFPKCPEGDLTRIRVALVCGKNLAKVGKNLGLDKLIRFGKSEQKTGMRGMEKALEDVVEACIAAIYIDGGSVPMRRFIDHEIVRDMSILDSVETPNSSKKACSSTKAELNMLDNPKSTLQTRVQKHGKTPKYTIINEYGPAHDKQFVAQVSVDGKVLAKGKGKSKKEAECNAATKALRGYTERL